MGYRPQPFGRNREGDEGQLIILIIGFTVIAALLVTVVTNVSKVFLHERSLAAAADDAAIAAASAIDETALYESGVGADGRLPLSQSRAGEEVCGSYATATDLSGRFRDFQCSVLVEGSRATVTFGAVVELQFVNVISGELARYRIEVAASAESPVRIG